MRLPFLSLILVFAAACGGWAPLAFSQQQKKYQPVPKDPSLQPLPPDRALAGHAEFIGNKSFTPDQLRVPLTEQLREVDQHGLTRPRADDTAYYLSIFYRKNGFPDAEVGWDIRGSRLLLKITEGPRTYLGEITFQGNQAEDTPTLFSYLIGGTQENLLKKPATFPFVQADLENGVARIRGLYESEGRPDAVVDDPVITFSKDHTKADVLVKIVEGPHYTFAAPRFEGEPLFEADKLTLALGEAAKDPFTAQRVNTMQQNLLFYYKLQGYYAAKVVAAAEPKAATPPNGAERKVPLNFMITPGPMYRFDGITVTGLERLHPDFMQKRFRSLTGQVYNPTKLDERFREVLRSGLFRNLKIATTPVPGNEVRVDLTAEEAKAKEIGFSVGFSTYEGIIFGLRLADRNFMGNGRPLTLDTQYSQRGLRAELLYQDPWWFDSDYNLRARIFVQERDEEGYSKEETGVRADVTRKINKNVELGGFLTAKAVGLTNTAIEQMFLGNTSYQLIGIGYTQTFDYRDSPVSPTKGWIIGGGLDADAVSGNLAFARGTGRLSYYIPVYKKTILALGARGGLIFPFTSVPIDERFFNGGGTTVRSFTERELGPRDRHNYPIGGEAFTVFNAEVDFPLRDALFGAVFADAGNVVSEFKNAGLSDMRFALGVGIRYQLPVGPIRLDVGVNPDPHAGEDWGAVNFSFGFAF